MALPAGLSVPEVQQARSGVVLTLFPTSAVFSIDVLRATLADGSDSTIIATVPGTQRLFVDPLPTDGVTWYYNIRQVAPGFSASPELSCWFPAVAERLPARLPAPEQPIAPTFRKTTSETATLGTLTLDPVDPQCRIVQVEFREQVGNGDPTAYADKLFPYEHTVDLVEKHPSKIWWRITYYDAAARQQVDEGFVTMDVGTIPNVADVHTTEDEFGNVTAVLIGDSDTGSFKVLVDSAPHTAAEVAATGIVHTPSVGERVVTVPNITTIASGEVKIISVIGYSQAGGAGQSGPVFHKRLTGSLTGVAVVNNLQLDNPRPNVLQVNVELLGAQTWRSWARIDSWPTVDGTINGPLDPKYERFFGPAEVLSYEHQATTGTWHVIVVPYNPGGSPGERATAQLAVSAAGNAALENVFAFDEDIETSVFVRWEHTPDVNNTDYDLEIYRNGVLLSSTVDPTAELFQDTGADPCDEGPSTCVYQTLDYNLRLIETATAITKNYWTSISGWYDTT